MTAGDVVSDVDSLANGANLDYQPAAGVQACITQAGGSGNACYTTLYDGTNECIIAGRATAFTDIIPYIKIWVNNTNYLRLTNDSGGAIVMGYSGVQIP